MVDDAMVYPPVENVWSLRRGFVLTALEGRRSPGFVPFETAHLSRTGVEPDHGYAKRNRPQQRQVKRQAAILQKRVSQIWKVVSGNPPDKWCSFHIPSKPSPNEKRGTLKRYERNPQTSESSKPSPWRDYLQEDSFRAPSVLGLVVSRAQFVV